MHIPEHFAQPDVGAMHQLMSAHPLATIVTMSSGGLNANHIPLQVIANPAPYGMLRGHVARANPMWKDIARDIEVLAIFHGPDSYVTPGWYASKSETGRVVPTWNYAVVHAYGNLRIIDDAKWVRNLLEDLTRQHEAGFSQPWKVSDAPSDYLEKQMGAIVGIEIELTRLTGKWKVSQNQPERNQHGVIEGLNAQGGDQAAAMAQLVARCMRSSS